jgi:hypothetical protein
LISDYCEALITKLLLDSREEFNVIDAAFFKGLQKYTNQKVQLKLQPGTISCAYGTKMRRHRIALLQVQIGTSSVKLNFTGATDLDTILRGCQIKRELLRTQLAFASANPDAATPLL